MVVHFCTEKAKRIELNGKEKKYLDQINDPTIAPIIYDKQKLNQDKKTAFKQSGYLLAKGVVQKNQRLLFLNRSLIK